MDVIDPIMETGESFLGIEDDQNTLQVRILGILGQLKSRMPASISGLLYNSLHFSTIQIILLKKILV